MVDISWLTNEAHRIHHYFASVFYLMITVLLLVGILVEYFRFPLGQVPSFGVLLGRAFIAILLLSIYNEIANTLATLTDAMAEGIGGFDNLDAVLKKMSEKVDGYSGDWLNARSLIMTVLSILTYTFLFYSVIIAEAAHIFTWTLLYVFAPLLIALFVIPATSGATKALFRSLIETCFWKIVWATLAALLWASVLVDMNNSGTIDFIKMICVNLILGGSLLATPFIVHALATSGLAGFTRNFTGIATAAGFMTPMKAARKLMSGGRRMTQSTRRIGGGVLGSAAGKAASSYAQAKVNSAKKFAKRSIPTIKGFRSKTKKPTSSEPQRYVSSKIKNVPIVPTGKRRPITPSGVKK